MACAHQRAAVARDQRKHMAGRDDVARPLGRIDGDGDRVRAVMRGDAGGDAFLRLDRDRERGLVRRAVDLRHHRDLELLGALLRQRQADEAAAVLRHEVHGIRRAHLRRDDEVALVLAVLGIDQDEHLAVARGLDDVLDLGDVVVEDGDVHAAVSLAT